jgi:hypothetical protein
MTQLDTLKVFNRILDHSEIQLIRKHIPLFHSAYYYRVSEKGVKKKKNSYTEKYLLHTGSDLTVK